MKRFFTFMLLLFVGAGLSAQSSALAKAFLEKGYADLGLAAEDVADLRVSDAYSSPDGTEHIYLAQYYKGIPVFNAQAILHYQGRNLVSKSIDLSQDLAAANLPSSPTFNAHNAVFAAASAVAPAFGQPIFTEAVAGEQRFVWPAISSEPLTATLIYLPTDDGVKLSWSILIDQHESDNNYYHVVVDATNGDILDNDNLVIHCSFGNAHTHDFGAACNAAAPVVTEAVAPEKLNLVDGAIYNVVAFGEESPIHGGRVMEVNPADSIASPFGWHDIDGNVGPEFTITRGNNVWAYPDREVGDENNNTPDGEEANGGAELIFDFPFSVSAEPDSTLRASMVQSFYTSNKVHDWMYMAGFDEQAGNFQRNNYKNGGIEGDAVRAEVQDGTGRGNANFFTPSDGNRPRMQMMLFDQPSSRLQVTAPESLAGGFVTGTADFGPDIALNDPVAGRIVVGFDNSESPNLGCEALANPNEIDGNIALIDRGDCFFVDKVLNAQNAGATAVIICNNEPGLINMTGDPAMPITIPSVNMALLDCNELKMAINNGVVVEVNFEDKTSPARPSDFDAGIVAHEIGHGVSNRLVGGPSADRCLFNDENMGEGWSDFLALASTPFTNSDDPASTDPRGIGNFAIGRAVDGPGIRTQPYTTDPALNDKDYDEIIFTGQGNAPHPVGEVWTAVLWDIFWFFSDRDGLDRDLINGTGGNNRAVRLVVEGMKFTRCNPGMLDARDGILEANRVVFGGEDQCEIWQIFADRGMGFSAQQGSTDNRTDNRIGNDLSPFCDANVQLTKSVDSDMIDAGEVVRYTLTAFSYREGATENVTITETIPEGMTVDEASVRGVSSFVIDGSTMTFNLGTMNFEDEIVIEYDAMTDETLGSESFFFDGAEEGDDNWELVNTLGNDLWFDAETNPFEGDLVWFVANVEEENDQSLELAQEITVTGDQPALRFWTRYDTEPGWDGGIIEISSDGATTWERVLDEAIVRGAFRGVAANTAVEGIRNTGSFWGASQGYEEIIVDLEEYQDEDILIRFRFLSDDNTGAQGWWVDNIEMVDIFNYDGTATLTSDAGDNFTTSTGDLGVIAYNAIVNNVQDAELGQTTVNVFPNPAGEIANVNITTERAGAATIQLLTVDGRMVFNRDVELIPGSNVTAIATEQLPAGVYVVQVTGAARVSSTKLTIQ